VEGKRTNIGLGITTSQAGSDRVHSVGAAPRTEFDHAYISLNHITSHAIATPFPMMTQRFFVCKVTAQPARRQPNKNHTKRSKTIQSNARKKNPKAPAKEYAGKRLSQFACAIICRRRCKREKRKEIGIRSGRGSSIHDCTFFFLTRYSCQRKCCRM